MLLRNSACIGWLEGEAEEGGVFAERTLFALAGECRIAELAGIACRAGLDHGGEDAHQFVGQSRVGSDRVGEKTKTTSHPTACPVVCDAALEPRGELERRGAGCTTSLVALPVHDVLHVLNAQHDRDTLIEEFRAVGGARIMA